MRRIYWALLIEVAAIAIIMVHAFSPDFGLVLLAGIQGIVTGMWAADE